MSSLRADLGREGLRNDCEIRRLVSPRAQRDLDGIWDFTAGRWAEAKAEAYIRQIWKAVRTIAADPRRGQPCDEVRAGYMKYPVGSHMLYYRRVGKSVDVVRILHERLDFEQHL